MSRPTFKFQCEFIRRASQAILWHAFIFTGMALRGILNEKLAYQWISTATALFYKVIVVLVVKVLDRKRSSIPLTPHLWRVTGANDCYVVANWEDVLTRKFQNVQRHRRSFRIWWRFYFQLINNLLYSREINWAFLKSLQTADWSVSKGRSLYN